MQETRVINIDPVKDSRWDEFVMAHEGSMIYHHSVWGKLIGQTYGYKPYFLALEDNQYKIKGVLPLLMVRSRLTGDRLVCLSFAHVCGPLTHSLEDSYKLIEHALNYAKSEKVKYVEIRSKDDMLSTLDVDFVKYSYFSTFILDLCQDADILWQQLKKQRTIQYSIKKAQKSNINIRVGNSSNDMEKFYKLNLITRKKHGMPPQPTSFFQNLWTLLIKSDMARILLAEYNNKAIAGIVLFTYKDTVTYAYSASYKDYASLCPIHLLLWEAIQWACRSGYRYFDFGRTSPDNKGLMDFKKRWGTRQIPILHYYWPSIAGLASTEENSIKFQILTSLWRKLPTTFTQILASRLYKHLG